MSVKPARVGAFGVILRKEGAPKTGFPYASRKYPFRFQLQIYTIIISMAWLWVLFSGCCFSGSCLFK